MREIKYPYIIKDGDGKVSNSKAFKQELSGLKDGRYELVIREYKRTRSLDQNSLMHKYFDIIADETGNTLQRVKDSLKKEFLTTDLKDDDGNIVCNPKTGVVMSYVRDTHDLEVEEMSKFIDEIRLWALDWGIYLPTPEESRLINFK